MSKITTDFKSRAAELFFGLLIFFWAFHFLILSVFHGNENYFGYALISVYLIILGVLTAANGITYSKNYRKVTLWVGYYSWIFLVSLCIITGGPVYSIYVYIFFFLFSAFLGLRLKTRKVW
jgi:hypothetical protein